MQSFKIKIGVVQHEPIKIKMFYRYYAEFN